LAKPKIIIGTPYQRQGTLCVPVRYNFSDGTIIERVYNWNLQKDPDEIEQDVKRYYQEEWIRHKAQKEAKALGADPFDKWRKKLGGKKIMKVTAFDDEPELPDDP